MANAARRAIRAMVVLMAVGTVLVAGRADAQEKRSTAPDLRNATIVLHAVNYANLSREVLDVATARVAMIYERIGVRTVWVDGEVSPEQSRDGQLHLSILLLSRDMAEKQIKAYAIKNGVLGQAHVPGRRASIFCDRIAATPGALPHFPIPLGDVIAHEVGHLLLGANSHSGSGIMRANVDVRALRPQSFDEAQARALRARLNDDPRPAAR